MRGGHVLINTTQPVRPVACSSLRPCNCGLIHAFYLSVSFSYLHSAVGVSFDIKKACRKPYRGCCGCQYFIVLNVSVEFVLIYRPHPVLRIRGIGFCLYLYYQVPLILSIS